MRQHFRVRLLSVDKDGNFKLICLFLTKVEVTDSKSFLFNIYPAHVREKGILVKKM